VIDIAFEELVLLKQEGTERVKGRVLSWAGKDKARK
jgi:hypothetical protein